MLLLFCCEPLYSSVMPLLCYWVRFVMATQVNYSSLELIVAFSVFVNAIFAGDGLIYVSCSGEYFECAILLDRLYLGVSLMHLDILFQDTMLCMERQHCLMSTSLIICGAFYVICGASYIICGAFHIIRTTFLIICGTFVIICGTSVMICSAFVVICRAFVIICGTFVIICSAFVFICGAFFVVCGGFVII